MVLFWSCSAGSGLGGLLVLFWSRQLCARDFSIGSVCVGGCSGCLETSATLPLLWDLEAAAIRRSEGFFATYGFIEEAQEVCCTELRRRVVLKSQEVAKILNVFPCIRSCGRLEPWDGPGLASCGVDFDD